jgi:8-oxo-dGTP pyrophosphatase MutT (NUDIX family)
VFFDPAASVRIPGMVPLDVATIASALGQLGAREDATVSAARKAAVAAIVRDAPGGPELLFIRRSDHPRDPWSGQMGLPGGRVDPGDPTPFAAAVRETAEEIGLDLAGLARPIGQLSEVRTHLPLGAVPHSVVPFVFAIEGEPVLTVNYEVQEALWVPLAFLSDRRNRSAFTWIRGGIPIPMPCFQYDGRVIWGLTLRIVEELLEACPGGA